MNHLRRFNESDEFIIPIDVESDVKEFRNKFFTEDIKRRFSFFIEEDGEKNPNPIDNEDTISI